MGKEFVLLDFFDKDKKYIFSKKIYEEYLVRNFGKKDTVKKWHWTSQCDSRQVRVLTKIKGLCLDFPVEPKWCKEIDT